MNKKNSIFGFSLVSVLIYSVILGGLSVVFSKMLINSNKSAKSVSNRSEFLDLTQLIRLMSFQGDRCNGAFVGVDGTEIKYQETVGGYDLLRIEPANDTGSGKSTLVDKATSKLNVFRMRPHSPVGATKSFSESRYAVVVEIETPSAGTIGARSFKNEIPLVIETAIDGTIIRCSDPESITVAKICTAFGFDINPDTGQCGTFVQSVDCAAEGKLVTGIDSSGLPICGLLPPPPPPPATCWAGTRETTITSLGTFCPNTPGKTRSQVATEIELNSGCNTFCSTQPACRGGGAVNGTCKNNSTSRRGVGTEENPGVITTCQCY